MPSKSNTCALVTHVEQGHRFALLKFIKREHIAFTRLISNLRWHSHSYVLDSKTYRQILLLNVWLESYQTFGRCIFDTRPFWQKALGCCQSWEAPFEDYQPRLAERRCHLLNVPDTGLFHLVYHEVDLW